jgi:hypothetical protein
MKALTEAGFDENNPEHVIVVCGDLFDRMDESLKVYDFAKDMIEKGKLIYIKGNHESLLEDCISRGYPLSYDWSNGTAKTVIDLAPDAETFIEGCSVVQNKMQYLADNTVNYVETKNYIFVHSWIPMICEEPLPAYYTRGRTYAFNPDWRNAPQKEWNDAMWVNPFNMAVHNLNQTGKTIIFGHWHCSTGWAKDEGRSEFGPDAEWTPYYGKGFISIDACTAHSGKCNVIVIEDEFLEDNDEKA